MISFDKDTATREELLRFITWVSNKKVFYCEGKSYYGEQLVKVFNSGECYFVEVEVPNISRSIICLRRKN